MVTLPFHLPFLSTSIIISCHKLGKQKYTEELKSSQFERDEKSKIQKILGNSLRTKNYVQILCRLSLLDAYNLRKNQLNPFY